MSLIKKAAFFLLCAGVLYVQSVFSPGSHSSHEDSYDGLSDYSDDDEAVWVTLLASDGAFQFAVGIAVNPEAELGADGNVLSLSVKLDDLVAGNVTFAGTHFTQKTVEDPENLHDETVGAIRAFNSSDNQLVGWFIPNPA